MNRLRTFLDSYHPNFLGIHKQAAVLIPLIEKDNEWHLLYEVRSQSISAPGEISFPGGRVHPNEPSQAAAVRECAEELNIDPTSIQVIGQVDSLIASPLRIDAFVGVIPSDVLDTFVPNDEVDAIFTISIDQLIHHPPQYHAIRLKHDPDYHDFPFELVPGGRDYPFDALRDHAFPFYNQLNRPEILWGFTAQLTEHFIELYQQAYIEP